jgi:O-antigen ligase/tetratricopeptide (TPR) repeat protein
MERTNSLSRIYSGAIEIIWLAVIFVIPLYFNPQSYQIFGVSKVYPLQFLVISMLGFWLAGFIQSPAGGRKLNWRETFTSPLHVAILVFGLLAVVSTAASITPAISFWGGWERKAGLLNLICLIVFFLIVAQQMRSRKQLLRAMYTLLISSGVVSILGILQYYFPNELYWLFHIASYTAFNYRVVSTIGNPLFLSSFLAMVIPLNLALIVYVWGKRKDRKNIGVLIGLVIVLALEFWCLWLAQYSITILLYIIGTIVFIMVWGIVKRKKLLLGIGFTSLIILMVIAGLLLAPLLFLAPVVETPGYFQNPESAQPAEKVGLHTLGLRVQFWQSTVDMILKSPEVPFSNDKLHFLRKVIGYGPETFEVTFQLFFPENMKSNLTDTSGLIDRPHNDYLYLAATMGLLGLAGFLSILVVFFYLCAQLLRRARDDMDKLLLMAMVGAMVQYMADIFFNISTISAELVFWLILALVPVIGRFIIRKETDSTSPEEAPLPESGATSRFVRTRFFLSLGCAITLILVGFGVAIRPAMANVYLDKGVHLSANHDEHAIFAFDKATELDPGEAAYWYYLGAYTYSVARSATETPLKAEVLQLTTDSFMKVRELRPYIAFDSYTLADVYTYWAASGYACKWPLAMHYYDEATQLFPNNAVIFDKWAQALIIKDDFDQARAKLDYAASVDPVWPKTSFLYGLLLAKEGKYSEAALKIIEPIENDPSNLKYFIDVCRNLTVYDMVRPLDDSLKLYTETQPDEWTLHAVLGVTGLFVAGPDESLSELNRAMLLVPDNDATDLFRAILRLSNISPDFRNLIPTVAADWRDKLTRSPERDTLLPLLDQFASSPK